MNVPMTAAKGFIAGCLSVATVMVAAWLLTRAAGFIPATAPPFWSMTPAIPPFGVPRFLNLIFWGGVWGLFLNLIFARLSGGTYWVAWFLAGAILVAGGAIFVVPLIKSTFNAASLTQQRFLVSGFINGMFGLGTALWLMIFGRQRQ